MLDNIRIIFNVSDENKKTVNLIEKELELIKIEKNNKNNILKIKSKVRSVHSSLAIEANSLSFESVSKIINDKLVLGKRKEIQEVKNAYLLYETMNDYKWKSENDFIKAHLLLMKYFEDDGGKYRNHKEVVKKGKKIIFMAPESILVPSMMKSLFEFLNASDEHPLIIASVFHYYLVYIHPFTDGNGRIARFWVSLILNKYNSKFEYIPIEEELYINQIEYYESISKCHINGNANEFINFMLKIIYSCIRNTTQKTTQKEIAKLNYNQQKIIELIKENSKITRKELAINLGITTDGIKYNINKLISLELIERVGPKNGGHWIIKSKLN